MPTTFDADTGSAAPLLNVLEIVGDTIAAGTTPVVTTGATNVITVQVQTSQALAATDASKIGLCNFDSASFSVDANGFVTLAGGTQAIDSIGVDATSGGGTNPVLPTAAGLVTVNGARVAAGTNPVRSVSTAANVYQIQVQTSQALASTDATKVGLANFDSSSFAVDANGFVTASGTGLAKTITGDSGGALSPTGGNWNILGLSGSKTSGSGSTLTIKSPPYADSTATTLTVNSGTFATAAGAYVLPAAPAVGDLVEIVCITTGIVVTANTGQEIQIGADVSSSAGTATNSAKGDCLCLRYRATDTAWYATSAMGVWVTA